VFPAKKEKEKGKIVTNSSPQAHTFPRSVTEKTKFKANLA